MMLRPPEEVMSIARAAASVPTPLAFPRAAMRELVRGRWQVKKLRFELDDEGRGEVLYQLVGAGWTFHFFLISGKLAEEEKTDRNYAASWDAMGVLAQGEWTPQREAHLRREIPKQRAGYADYDTLMHARGNRSARVFDHVVDRLASGQQPDLSLIAPVGYILRTTAFIGNGALGTRPLAGFEADHPLRRPYHAQFASGFMLREYVFDLVDHIARARNPRAARLAPAWRRFLGLGNSAATGLSAFVTNRPHLIHQWVRAHESAAAQARARVPTPGQSAQFAALLDRAILHFRQAAREPDGVFQPPQALADELLGLREAVRAARQGRPWSELCDWARDHLGAQSVEVLQSLLLELYPDIVAAHDDDFLAPERFEVDPAQRAGDLLACVERDYGWALRQPSEAHHFWYRSSAAPRDTRRGPRAPAGALARENNFDTQLQVRRLRDHLKAVPADAPVAAVTSARPDLRHIVARVQALAGCGYAELRYDWLAQDFSPFATIRLPLTFFGMEKLEAALPKSVRGVFLQGAPIAEDVAAGRDGAWPFPLIPASEADGAVPLAPLPASTGAPRVLPQPPAFPAMLRIAPGELARMVAVALQGHGAPLGVAEDAGMLAAAAQGFDARAIAAVIAHCRGGLRAIDVDPSAAGRDRHELQAHGACALLAAPAVLDLALGAGQRASVLVRGAADAWLAQALPWQCAKRGLAAVLAWRSGGNAGFSRAFPQGGGSGWLCGPLAQCALQVPPEGDFFLLQVGPDLPACDPGAARIVEAMLAQWQLHGVALAAADFTALAEAGKALLVPHTDEPRFLPAGIDPLKTF